MSVTPFQQRVYDAVALIPEGRVSTYKAVAARIRCGAPRAVGQALRQNPFAPSVPCHRVIAADLTPGGFQGETEGPVLHRKVSLLKREGVLFENGRLVEPGRLFTFGKR